VAYRETGVTRAPTEDTAKSLRTRRGPCNATGMGVDRDPDFLFQLPKTPFLDPIDFVTSTFLPTLFIE
jgi:hypothetical protein